MKKLRLYTFYLFGGTILLWLAVLTLALAGIFIGSDWTNRSWMIKAFSLLIIPNSLYMISGAAYLAVVYALVFLVLMAMSNVPKKWIAGSLMMPVGLA